MLKPMRPIRSEPSLLTASPFGAVTGAALDVIVVAPPPPSSGNRDNHSRNCSSCRFPDTCADHALPNATVSGVVASSDFFVTFPSSTGPSLNNPLSTSSLSNKRLDLRFHYRSLLPFSNTSRASSNSDVDSSEKLPSDDDKSDVFPEKSDLSQFDRENVDLGVEEDRNETSERSCSHGCSDSVPSQPNLQKLSGQRQKIIPPNVQVQINGRRIPELDMVFQVNRSRRSLFGGSSGESNDRLDHRCRFADGNELRPPAETLTMLLGRNSESRTEETSFPLEDKGPSPSADGEHVIGKKNDHTSDGFILHFGRNLIRYSLCNEAGSILGTAEAHLYLWSALDSVVVSDVDGTVTKSDVRGVIDTVIQDKFQHVHTGICKFYHDLLVAGSEIKMGNENCHVKSIHDISSNAAENDCEENYSNERINKQQLSPEENQGQIRFLYLSSRPISIISQTRKLLVSLSQHSLCDYTDNSAMSPSLTPELTSNNNSSLHSVSGLTSSRQYGLPPGPILCHTGTLSSVLYAELIAKNIYEFKADVLTRQVVLPFIAARGKDWKKREIPANKCCSCNRSMGKQLVENVKIDNNMNEEKKITTESNDANDSTNEQEQSQDQDNRLFLAGFGNKLTDAIAYEMAGMDRRDVYIINKESQILCMGDIERNCLIGSTKSRNKIEANQMEDKSRKWGVPEICCFVSKVKRSSSDTLTAEVSTGVSHSKKSVNRKLSAQNRSKSLPLHSNKAPVQAIELFLNDEEEEAFKPDTMKTSIDITFTTEPPIGYESNDRSVSTISFDENSSYTDRQPSGAFSSSSSRISLTKLSEVLNGSNCDQYGGYNDPRLFQSVCARMSE